MLLVTLSSFDVVGQLLTTLSRGARVQMTPTGGDQREADIQRETKAMLAYLLGHAPSDTLLERSMKALGQSDREPIGLPAFAVTSPRWMALIEPVGRPGSARQSTLRRRLNICLILAEASTEGVDVLRRRSGSSPPMAVIKLVTVLVVDAFLLPARMVFSRLLK